MSESAEAVNAKASALEQSDELSGPFGSRCLVLFLDYDGTLTPIVRHPDLAVLSEEMRGLLKKLSTRCTVAIVSGRDLADLRAKVGIGQLFYAGSHGFELAGPGGWRREAEGAQAAVASLNVAERDLRERVASIGGAWVERKGYGLAVHYREAAPADVPSIEQIVVEVAEGRPDLHRAGGKMVFELQPAVGWNKGSAVRLLLEELRLGDGALPIYVGDDATDEDGFLAVAESGIGIVVTEEPRETAARYALRNPAEVQAFLEILLREIE